MITDVFVMPEEFHQQLSRPLILVVPEGVDFDSLPYGSEIEAYDNEDLIEGSLNGCYFDRIIDDECELWIRFEEKE